jgi:hypothetical protein
MTAANVDKNQPVQFRFRLNTPYDMIMDDLGTAPASGAVFGAKGRYGVPMDVNGTRAGIGYPTTMDTTGNASEKPAWRDYWAAFYDFYTVIGCEYKIIVNNPIEAKGGGAVIGVQMDSFSDTAGGGSGNVMPIANYCDTIAFKGMRWYKVECLNDAFKGNSTQVIFGKYKPGSIKRNIVNDGDVKTWTATGATLPNLKEILTINVWKDPMGTLNANTGLNMEVQLKYIVQYKDLKLQARYPNDKVVDQDINVTLNENRYAAGGMMTWGPAPP